MAITKWSISGSRTGALQNQTDHLRDRIGGCEKPSDENQPYDPQDNVRCRHRRRDRRRGAHPDRSFRWRRGQGWWHGWWNGWPSRSLGPWLRLRWHRGHRTQLLAMGARRRQGIRLLLNRHRPFQYLQKPRSRVARPGSSICEMCERHASRLVAAKSSASWHTADLSRQSAICRLSGLILRIRPICDSHHRQRLNKLPYMQPRWS